MFRIGATLQTTDCLIVCAWEGEGFDEQTRRHIAPWSATIRNVRDLDDFHGKKGEISLIYGQNVPAKRLLIVGLGKREKANIKNFKESIGAAVVSMQQKKVQRAALIIPESVFENWGNERVAQEISIAALLANYSFDTYKSEDDAQVKPITDMVLITGSIEEVRAEIEAGFAAGIKIAESINDARQLGNTPPNDLTPSFIAQKALELDEKYEKINTKILSLPEIKDLKMGCFLGVAQGSVLEPKFVIIEYFGGEKEEKPTVFVGKGITFDSGGLSIKPGNYMCDMKFDMLGAATVYGILQSVAKLGLKRNVVGLIPTCENMPSANAYRPDDILRAMNGKTVEIGNTDAEGRLILADALCYAKKYQPKEVIDFATLTGACMVAIGTERSGLFSEERKLIDSITTASETVGEQLWHLPLGEEFSEAMKSEVADIKNVSSMRYAGASTAAAFLQFFTEYPWAHIDLSSSYYKKSGKPWIRQGANGFGVQTMIEYLKRS